MEQFLHTQYEQQIRDITRLAHVSRTFGSVPARVDRLQVFKTGDGEIDAVIVEIPVADPVPIVARAEAFIGERVEIPQVGVDAESVGLAVDRADGDVRPRLGVEPRMML